MNILFSCYSFSKENLRLMPWRYIFEIAKGLFNKGENVSIFSIEHNKAGGENIIDGIKIYSIHRRDIFKRESCEKIFASNDIIIWSSSPRTVFYYKNLQKINKPFILLFTGPFYSLSDIVEAQAAQVPFRQLSSHYKNAISSPKLLSMLINKHFVKKAVVLSEHNARFLKRKGASETKIAVIPPGYDAEPSNDIAGNSLLDARKALTLPEEQQIFTYMGSLYQIRGVNILIEAFRDVCRKVDKLMLLILARTNESAEIERVTELIRKYGLENRAKVVSGFLEKKRVADYLVASDAVVLPFLLVPSDMPLGALEAMAMGKPVIASDIDGMPEMVQDRGILVKPGDRNALANALLTLSRDSGLYNSLQANCFSYMSQYPTWEATVNRVVSALL